jgi:hypothetical protein
MYEHLDTMPPMLPTRLAGRGRREAVRAARCWSKAQREEPISKARLDLVCLRIPKLSGVFKQGGGRRSLRSHLCNAAHVPSMQFVANAGQQLLLTADVLLYEPFLRQHRAGCRVHNCFVDTPTEALEGCLAGSVHIFVGDASHDFL